MVEAALMYESNIDDRFDKVIVTWCRPEQQVERLMAKAGLSREDAERRVQSQMSSEEKRKRAAYVIDCSGGMESTKAEVVALYRKLRQLADDPAWCLSF